MPGTICREPERDLYELREDNTQTISPFSWSQNYTDPPFFTTSANYSESSNTTPPISPTDLSFPSATYTLPSSIEDFSSPPKPLNSKQNDQSQENFSFGTFEDWMRWDDPSDTAPSPTTSLDYFPIHKIESPMTNISHCHPTEMTPQNESASFNRGERMEIESPLFQSASLALESDIDINVPREHLYSTPLSWTRPTLAEQDQPRTGSYTNILTAEEALRLREIAMPSFTPQALLIARSPSISSSPSPSPPPSLTHPQTHKRKSTSSETSASHPPSHEHPSSSSFNASHHTPVKKTAHNMIEKRYRTNLNDKIAALRDSVPSLRSVYPHPHPHPHSNPPSRKIKHEDGIEAEDLHGLEAACKLNKATILSKATEYIAHLEKRNRSLMRENTSLKDRVDAFELLVMGGQGAPVIPQQMQPREERVCGSMGGQAGSYGGKY